MSVEIGQRIAKRRNELGLTQDDLANAVGRERHSISEYEKGTHTPRPKTLRAIARVLQIDITELTGASPPIKKPPHDDRQHWSEHDPRRRRDHHRP